ncbi:MAG TPA: hypothetical protein DDZ83_12260 [Nitrospinae bacterium]|nr:hypothetical protein [Nitrospinota bacterium]
MNSSGKSGLNETYSQPPRGIDCFALRRPGLHPRVFLAGTPSRNDPLGFFAPEEFLNIFKNGRNVHAPCAV